MAERTAPYWVYNAPNGTATAHRRDCVHCRDGKGQIRAKASTIDWHPFPTREAAIAFALRSPKNRICGHCKPQEGGE